MEYKKNKLRLNEIASAMHGFYFLVEFCLVLIYILKVYFKRSFSILLIKKIFHSLLVFFFWRACTFSIFETFSVENLEITLSTFLSKFSFEIYLSRIIIYWGIIFTLCWTRGALSLVCVLSVFFFFLSSFFLFLSVFSLTGASDS